MARTETTWKPGQSGNPNGRPKKGLAVSEVLQAIANAKEEGGTRTRLRVLLEKLWRLAEDGDIPAARVLLPYLQPEPRAVTVETAPEEFGPITILEFKGPLPPGALADGRTIRQEPGFRVYEWDEAGEPAA